MFGTLDVAALAAWLARHQGEKLLLTVSCALAAGKAARSLSISVTSPLRFAACLHLCDDGSDGDDTKPKWNDSLTALPASLVVSLSTSHQSRSNVSILTALTRLHISSYTLEWSWDDCSDKSISPRHLQPLMRLRQLSLRSLDLRSNAEELLSLPALAGLQALAMPGCWLRTMPRALSAHTQLTALDLSGYGISTFKPLATLQRLQRLELSGDFTAVPAQLSALTALTHLGFTEVEGLNRGWQHLLPLTQLQSLRVRLFTITAVPAQLSALMALTRLDLHRNSLSGNWQYPLPLSKLQHLDLSNCCLTALPQQLSALTALTSLDLTAFWPRGNSWQLLLPLVQLRELILKESKLKAVPEQVSVLTALTSLDLAGNRKLNGGRQHLLSLTNLQDLNLSGCKLKAVPDQLSAALTRLNLHANNKLTGGWQNLLCLTQLRHLDLSHCHLPAVPQQFSVLTALTNLNLSDNSQLAGGWQHLLPLIQLQHLDLFDCHLTAVPQQFSVLTALTTLQLTSNSQLAGGWQHLLPLTQLRFLNVEHARLHGQQAQDFDWVRTAAGRVTHGSMWQ
jgi:ubiquitin-activating enzyme E1